MNEMEEENLFTIVLAVLQNLTGDTYFIVKFTILTLRQQKVLCKHSVLII